MATNPDAFDKALEKAMQVTGPLWQDDKIRAWRRLRELYDDALQKLRTQEIVSRTLSDELIALHKEGER